MKGIFYGVGVGPGDPHLLTLKAVNTIKECEVLAIAVADLDFQMPAYEPAGTIRLFPELLNNCVAYRIVLPVIPEIADKAKLYLPMPMIKDKEVLKKIHDACAEKTAQKLMEGKNVAFITLGDPSVYSTCLYVHKRLTALGIETQLIPGIPSFCAAAARLNIGLVENKEELHVIPASYEIEEGLAMPGTKVLMKAGKKMAYVKQTVKEQGLQIKMVENCGMDTERIYHHVDEIPEDAGYYSLLIVKEENE